MKRWIAAVTMGLALSSVASAQVVHFNDANLKEAVKEELGITRDPTAADMLGLTHLNANSSDIADLTGLEYARNLGSLWLFLNQITDIAPLASLTKLTGLRLDKNQISDLSPLASLTRLTDLELHDNQISDIAPLAGMTGLTVLTLDKNQISDLSPLAGLTGLTFLMLSDNQISDISALCGVANVRQLILNNNQISGLPSLSGLPHLWNLMLTGNQISDIFPLLGLTSLHQLFLDDNPLNADACHVYIPQILKDHPEINIRYDPCPGPPVVVTWPAWPSPDYCGLAHLRGYMVSIGDSPCEVRFGLQQCFPIFPYRCLEPVYTAWKIRSRDGDFTTNVDVNPGEDYTFWAEWRNATSSGRGEKLSFTTPAGVKVPALTNMTRSQAQAALETVGLVLGTVSGDPAGKVASQSPAAARDACPGSAVAITLALGQVTVPDVVGMSELYAKAALEAAGFVVTIWYGPSDVTEGTVFHQDPVAGTVVLEGSDVSLIVSQPDDIGPGPGPGPTPGRATGGLVAHWKLDEATGTTAADASGNNHNGTVSGGAVWQPTGGILGGALQFDGVNDYIDCGNPAALNIQDQITLACWIKVAAFTRDWETILAKGDGSYRLSRSGGGNAVHFGIAGTSVGWFDGITTVTDNEWHHVAGVYDGSHAAIYVDGILDRALPATGKIDTSTYNLFIGENSQMRGRYLKGLVDDVRIYDRALDATEVLTLATSPTEP